MSKAVQLCWPCMSDLFCWSIPSNSRFQWPHKILQWHEDPEIIKFLQIFFKLPDWEGRHPIRISTETRDIICLIWLGGYWSAPVHWLDSAQISNWWGGCGVVLGPWVRLEMSALESTSELVVLQAGTRKPQNTGKPEALCNSGIKD